MSMANNNCDLDILNFRTINLPFEPRVTFSWSVHQQWKTSKGGKQIEILNNNTALLNVKKCDGRSRKALEGQKGVFVEKQGMKSTTYILCDGLYVLESEYVKMKQPEKDYVFMITFDDPKKKKKIYPKKENIIVIPHANSIWKYANDGRTKNSGGQIYNNARFITAFVNGKPLAFIETYRKINSGQLLVDYGDAYWEEEERYKLLSD